MKSFRDVDLALKPFTVLIGSNASGKSNVRDALAALHGAARGYSVAEILGGKWSPAGHSEWPGCRGGAREFVRHGQFTGSCFAEGECGPFPDAAYFLSILAGGADVPAVTWEDLGEADEAYNLIGMEPEVPWDLHSEWARRLGAAAAVRKAYGAPSPLIAHVAAGDIEAHAAARPYAIAVRDMLRNMRFLDLRPEMMREPSAMGHTTIGHYGENLSSVLKAICDDAALKSELLEWLAELTPVDVADLTFDEDAAGRVLLVLLDGQGQRTSAYSASDGTLRFLALLAALLAPEAGGLYFIEELENGIHPARLGLLTELIEQRTKAGNVQVIATTHSPALLTMLSPEVRDDAILIYRRESEGFSRAKRIGDIPHIREALELRTVGALLESRWLEQAVELIEETDADTEGLPDAEGEE